MNTLEEFENILGSKKYFFHFHTVLTDGKSSVEEYFDFALSSDFETIIFCEHIRKNPSYDVRGFLKEVKEIGKRYGLDYKIGFEAKVLPGGELDISFSVLKELEIIGIAVHSFPDNLALYADSLVSIFENEKLSHHIRIWVHPGRLLKKNKKLTGNIDLYRYLLSEAVKNDVYIEYNLKEDLPPLDILKDIKPSKIIVGFDAHSVNEAKSLNRKFAEINAIL